MKSSNTFCFFSNMPARCQSSPNSPPPRRLASAKTPPRSVHQAAVAEKEGVRDTLNPPYAVIRTGRLPSSFRPLRCTRNIGIFVPSLEAYQTCSDSMSSVWMGTLGRNHRSSAPVETMWRNDSDGCTKEVNPKKVSSSDQRPLGGEAEPMPGSFRSPRYFPSIENCLMRLVTFSRYATNSRPPARDELSMG